MSLKRRSEEKATHGVPSHSRFNHGFSDGDCSLLIPHKEHMALTDWGRIQCHNPV